METFVRRVAVISLSLSILTSPFQAAAQSPIDATSPDRHVRLLEPCRTTLLDDATRLSPTVEQLVDRLEHSDLVVYVRCAFLKNSAITGRMAYLGTTAGRRYVIVEIKLHDQYSTQIGTLAHELQHAVEVADAPSVRNSISMAAHYRAIGFAVDRHPMIFETWAARAVGDRVHRELFGASARTRAVETSAGSQ